MREGTAMSRTAKSADAYFTKLAGLDSQSEDKPKAKSSSVKAAAASESKQEFAAITISLPKDMIERLRMKVFMAKAQGEKISISGVIREALEKELS